MRHIYHSAMSPCEVRVVEWLSHSTCARSPAFEYPGRRMCWAVMELFQNIHHYELLQCLQCFTCENSRRVENRSHRQIQALYARANGRCTSIIHSNNEKHGLRVYPPASKYIASFSLVGNDEGSYTIN